jgi:hypothetical protein
MTQELINVGGANERQGDTPFVFCPKINRNFTELYSKISIDQQQMIYVTGAGNDLNSGLNINEPMLTIPAAIVKAALLTPSESNQIVITGPDASNFTDAINGIEWVHISFPNASYDGICTIADNTITRFRRMMRSTPGGSCIKKTTGAGFAKVEVDLLIVSDSTQNGFLLNSGVGYIDAGVITVDGGIAIKAKNGSRMSADVKELQLLSGGTGLGTQTAGGDANEFIIDILNARDDGTGVLIETKVDGDKVNIKGGSFIVNTLYDLGVNSTLNAFVNESSGARIADPTAAIHVVKANSTSRLTTSKGFLNQPLSIHDGLAGTETTLDFGTFNDGIYNLANGEITILQDIQSVQVLTETHVTKTLGGSDSEFSAWVEISSDGGSIWAPFPDSLRVEVISKDGGSVVISELTLGEPLSAGGMFRIRATNTGAAAISVLPPTDLVVSTGTADGFATKVTLRTLL